MEVFNTSRQCAALTVLALAAAVAIPASAQSGAAPVGSESPRLKPPLAPLPTAPSRRLGSPTAATLDTLDGVLGRIRALRGVDVQTGLKELLFVDSSLLPAIRRRLDEEAKRADRARMKRVLLDIRSEARDQIKTRMRQSGATGAVETPDYLEMVLTYPVAESAVFTSLVNVLAISRLCATMGGVEALRVLVHVYVRFDFLRIDTQLQLRALGDQALPILIETTRHPAPKVAAWADGQLDFLGKAIPSEAVQVEDPQILADVLRAYGRLRDPDAARLVASFANSERAQIREAARQSIGLFGEVANWQLRDTYEKMVGERPPRDWSWDRTAKELFREFDLIRLADLYDYYKQGLNAQQSGDLEAMRTAYEKVLTRDPTFKPSEQIANGLLRYAEGKLNELDGVPSESLASAMAALEPVARISDDESQRARAESLLMLTRAKQQVGNHIAEQLLLRRALDLDPQNKLAAHLLTEISREPVAESSVFMRFLWPVILLAVSLICALLVVVRRPKEEAPTTG